MRFLVLLLAMPTMALAQSPGDDLVDLRLLMRENADRVVAATDPWGHPVQRLDLGDGQRIECSDSECTGYDDHNATGCVWNWLSALRAMAQVCSVPTTAGLETMLDLQARYSVHIAMNALPLRSADQIEARYQLAVDNLGLIPANELAEACAEATGPDGFIAKAIASFANPDVLSRFETTLASPRLPFFEPCH